MLKYIKILKKNNINSEKIIEILINCQTLECTTEESKNFIKIKNFDKLNLIPLEQIIENNRENRIPKMQYISMGGIPFYHPQYGNFYDMQNNYYFQQPYYNSPNQYYQAKEANK